MVSLDAHQSCASAGTLQALQGEHHLGLRVKVAPVGLLFCQMYMLLLELQWIHWF